ncbi:SulP family inorganic anion transporter [Microbacterium sp. ASV49]|uniref:SulP family inorganic anion transporter n=1 Tax=Microbacterium candidum TaxID=3041922 RepID=A0ABT7MTC1_9MICO|nr:SulP family inorganic anion transporter [Microbacterium sp. ASV49]MDL9977706.1 SulP family inorganic anion transporter [Microbacterium sp. ASV49]
MSTTVAPTKTRWWLPSLVGYRRSWLVPDIVAGLSAGAVVVPQAMAYATIANMPVQVGLYTCIVPMFVYAILGGSRAMSVSTTSTIATLTATTLVSAGIAAGSKDALGSLMTLMLIVGVILVLARLLKLGSLVENISSATVLGVKIGVGATVAVGQVPKLLGETTNTSGEGFFRSVVAIGDALPSLNWPTVALSVGTILVLVLLKRFAPMVPGALVVVVGGILLVAFAGLPDLGVKLIAPVPSGLPVPGLPDFTHLGALLPGALAIAVMAFLESAAVSRTIRKMSEPPVDSNQELFATGAANVLGSFFTTMPAAGGFSQSAVNRNAGAKTQLATIVTVILAIAVALFLAPVLSLLPQATLAAMVFVAVVGLIDIPELVRWWSISRRDFWIALSVAFIGLTVGLLLAVAVGVAVTLILVLRELNIPRVIVGDRRGDAIVLTLDQGLYAANANANANEVVRIASMQDPPVTAVVLDVARLRTITITVLEAMEGLDRELEHRGVTLHLAALPENATATATHVDWYQGLTAAGRVHATVEEGLAEASAPVV